jgi:hypothetical protein
MPVRVFGISLARTNAFALVKGARRARRARERKRGCERVLKKPLSGSARGHSPSLARIWERALQELLIWVESSTSEEALKVDA